VNGKQIYYSRVYGSGRLCVCTFPFMHMCMYVTIKSAGNHVSQEKKRNSHALHDTGIGQADHRFQACGDNMYLRIFIHICVCMYTSQCMYTRKYSHIFVRIRSQVNVTRYMCQCTLYHFVYIYIHTYIYIYIYL